MNIDPKHRAVLAALNKMFGHDGHFSICVVRNCLDVLGLSGNKDLEILRLYHCHDYSTMDVDTLKYLFETTVNMICTEGFPELKIADRVKVSFSADSKGLLSRVLKLVK